MESRQQSGLIDRMRATFVAPRSLPHRIREATPWLDVLLVSTAIALLAVLTMPDDVFLEPMQDAVSRRGRPVEIVSPPEEIARWGRFIAMLATVGTHPVIAFVVAGLALVLFTGIMRGSTTYRELLSLTSHAMLIPALGTLAAVIVRLLAGPDSWFAPGEGTSLALRTLLSIDPLIVWMLIVIAVGAHGLDPRLSTGRSAAVLIAGYVLMVAASTAILHRESAAIGYWPSAGSESYAGHSIDRFAETSFNLAMISSISPAVQRIADRR